MKKSGIIAAALAAILCISGCNNANTPAQDTKKAEETTVSQTEAAQTEKTEEAAETEAAEAETDAPQTDAPEEDNSGKTAFFTALDDKVFYLEDTKDGEWDMIVSDRAVARIASGAYHDSDSEPELFNTEEFEYTGEYFPLGETTFVKAGDTIGGVKIASASTTFMPPYSEELEGYDKNATEGFSAFSSEIKLEGELKLTGIVRYYNDEQYAIASGDIHFIPDSSYKGLPSPVNPHDSASEPLYGQFGTKDFDVAGGYDDNYYGGGVCVYSDAPCLRLGNLNDDYADRTDIANLFDGAGANCTKKVEITLTDVDLSYSDQFGTGHSSAKIKEIKEI